MIYEFYQGVFSGAVLLLIAAVLPLWAKLIGRKRKLAAQMVWNDRLAADYARLETKIIAIGDAHQREINLAQAREAGLNAVFAELKRLRAIPDDVDAIAKNALAVMQEIQKRDPAQSGEWKRHQVLARLIKQYPDSPKWKLALAIEWAYKNEMAPQEK